MSTDWYDDQRCKDLTMEFVIDWVARDKENLFKEVIANDKNGIGRMSVFIGFLMSAMRPNIPSKFVRIDCTLAAREIKKLIDAKRAADAMVAAETNQN